MVAKTGRASVLVLLTRWSDALSALPTCEVTRTKSDWISLHIRAMVALKTGDFSAADKMLQNGISHCRFHDCQDYFHGAMASLRIHQAALADAALEISKLSDSFKVPRLALSCQLAIKKNDNEKALEILEQFPSPSNSQTAETFAELRRLALGHPPVHTEKWLFHQQLSLLAA